MYRRMKVWLKRGREFYLFSSVTGAVFIALFNFEVEKPLEWAGFSLQLMGALLSLYVVVLSYDRHSKKSLISSSINYIKDFPAFKKKVHRVVPAHTIITLKQTVVDTSRMEFKKIEKEAWPELNEKLLAITNAINSDRIYLELLDERTSTVGDKVFKELLPQQGADKKEQKEENTSSSRLMLVAFLWIITGMLAGSIPLPPNTL